MLWVIVLLSVPTVFYAVLVGTAAVGFQRTGRRPASSATTLPHVSVVIPARDEEREIGACIEAVLRNEYPKDHLELIVVDDGSQDRTPDIVASIADAVVPAGDPDGSARVRLVRLSDNPGRAVAHKKEALARGVEAAAGEIILTTDADCHVAPTWIRAMVEAFDGETGMVTGPVLYRRDGTLFGDLQALEFLGLVALGGGLVELGRPHLCNSANLAYRQDVYREIGGYDGLEDVSTGDDEMLMHRVAYDTAWDVKTCMRREAVVETDPNPSLSTFIQQRRRWASAHARYPHAHLTGVSVLVYAFYVGLAGVSLTAFFVPSMMWIAAVLFGLKIGVEAAVLVPAARRFDRGGLLIVLAPAELLHIVYVVLIGLAGSLGGYEWKGRRVPR